MKTLLVCVLLFIVNYGDARKTSKSKYIPDYVPICKRYDPEISKCWANTFNAMLPYIANGIPEMNIRALDPIEIDELKVDSGPSKSASVSFDATLKHLKLYGGKSVVLTNIEVDLENVNFEMSIFFPQLKLTSNYRAKGKVLLFQFDGTGVFTGEFENITSVSTWKGKKILKKGKEHILFTDSVINVQMAKLKVNFENLFKNNPEITDTINRSINENVDILYSEIQPIIEETVKSIITDGINNVYSLFPLDVLFPKE